MKKALQRKLRSFFVPNMLSLAEHFSTARPNIAQCSRGQSTVAVDGSPFVHIPLQYELHLFIEKLLIRVCEGGIIGAADMADQGLIVVDIDG